MNTFSISHHLILIFLVSWVIQSHCELRSTDAEVNEGPCAGYPPLEKRLPFFMQPEVPPPLSKIVTELSQPFTALVTYGSAAMFRTYAESFLGRPAKNEAEINEMCVTILCSGALCTQIGFKDKVYFSAGRQGSAVLVYSFANPLAMSPGVVEIPYEDGVVWSTKNHYLLSRCVNGQYRDWKLMSMTPLTPEVKSKVLDVIEKLGFNKTMALDLSPFCEKPSVSQAAIMALEGLGSSEVTKNMKQPIWNSLQNLVMKTRSISATTQLQGRMRKNACNFVNSARLLGRHHRSRLNLLRSRSIISPQIIENVMGVARSVTQPMAESFPSLLGTMTRMSVDLFNFVDTCKSTEEYHMSLIDPSDPFVMAKCGSNKNSTTTQKRRSPICRRLLRL